MATDSPSHPDVGLSGCIMYNNSLALRKQYRQDRSNNGLLTRCIDLAHKAVVHPSTVSPAVRAARLYHLGVVMEEQYLGTRMGSVCHIEAAINYKEQSLRIMPPDTGLSLKAQRLAGTGRAWGWRYQAAKDINDHTVSQVYFENTKTYFGKAIHALEESPSLQARVLQDLGVLFRDRYYETKGRKNALSYLRESVSYLERALEQTPRTPEAHKDRLRVHDVLGCVKGDLYQARIGEPEADDLLSECLHLAHLVVDGTPSGDHHRAERILNLGTTLQDRYLQSRKTKINDLHKALQWFEEAFCNTEGPTLIRMQAGRLALDALVETENWNRAVTVSEQILDLLAQITPRTHSNEDLERALRPFSGLGSVASSVFLRAGKDDIDAVQVLERGSSIVHGLFMDLRSANEHGLNPSSNIGATSSIISKLSAKSGSPLHADIVLPHDYAAEMLEKQNLSNAIDARLEMMQKRPKSQDLMDLASEGPIVCLNVTYLGSHAFLITKSQIKSIMLDQLTLQGIEECINATTSGYGSTRANFKSYTLAGVTHPAPQATAVPDIEGKMEWLWTSAVKPILGALNLLWECEPPAQLPSIWWVGGGSMALLPMNAAGYHHSGSTENTISHVVCSYIPSLKALQFSRRKVWSALQPKDSNKKPKMVIVTMPTTPGHHVTLKTEKEVEMIRQHVGEAASIEVLESPGKTAVLQNLEDCSILHMACHAELNRTSSFKSALLLGSGETQERLSVDDLRSIDLRSAQLAVLSACSTATFSDRTLPNEYIHLASTFQLLFRHVIGTIWDTYDEAAIEIAGKFYEKLLCESGTNQVSRALHQAVCEYRSEPENCKKILHWGSFIHTGP
jgi:hypothetical protein